MLLLLSISIWIILLYSLRVGILGNPAYMLVQEMPAGFLRQASEYLTHQSEPENETIFLFIRKFFRTTATAFVLFILEFVVALYFIFTDPKFTVPWIILVKNLTMLILGHRLNQSAGEDIFESVKMIPAWAIRWERISYLITSICFLFLFLLVNKLII